MRNLAGRLLALEAASETAMESRGLEAVQVCEKLRTCLIQFAGAESFTALMQRALALAKANVASLQNFSVDGDGRLRGIEEAAPAIENLAGEAGIAIIAQLLALLAAFIGEALTYRLVGQTWPDLTLDEP